jgi:hypothetical protein
LVGLNNFEPNQKFEIIKIKYNGAMILFKLMLQFAKHIPPTLKKKKQCLLSSTHVASDSSGSAAMTV